MIIDALMIIVLRRIRKVHWLLVLLSFGILGVVENVIVAAAFGVLDLPVGWNDCLLTYAVLPVTVYSVTIFLMLALKFEEAGRAVIVRTAGILFSYLL